MSELKLHRKPGTDRPWHIALSPGSLSAKEPWPQQILGPNGESIATLPAYRQRPHRDEPARQAAWADARRMVASVNHLDPMLAVLREVAGAQDVLRYGSLARGSWNHWKQIIQQAAICVHLCEAELAGRHIPVEPSPPGCQSEND